MPVYRRRAGSFPESAQDIDSHALLRAQKGHERHGTLYYVLLGLMASGRDTALNMVARGTHQDEQAAPERQAGGQHGKNGRG